MILLSLDGSLYWDFLRLFHELKEGIHAYKQHAPGSPASIAVDTGVWITALLTEKESCLAIRIIIGKHGMQWRWSELLQQRRSVNYTAIQVYSPYRLIRFFSFMPRAENKVYHCPMMFVSCLCRTYSVSIYQGYVPRSTRLPVQLGCWIQWRETGIGYFCRSLESRLDLFTDIVMPGTKEGTLRKEIAEELQVGAMPIVAAASHDTASAVVSIPSLEGDYAFISCGTWSLMGVEIDQPIMTEDSLRFGFTNEGGAEQKIRMLKNIMGLWLLQECKRQWELEGDSLSFAHMQEMAKLEPGLQSYVDPQDPVFLAPGNMPERIRLYCAETGQTVPQTKAELIRCVVDSLAMKFKQTLDEIEQLLARKLSTIHMVGGGIQNQLLCQLTANATGDR